jgi:chromosome segregation ATPase
MKDLTERREQQAKEKGKQNPGGGGGGGTQPSNSKEFAQLAAKQAALREALRKLQKEKQEQGKGDKMLDDIMDDMNKIETELVNKRLTNDMLQRQEQILTRLLEHEKAEREREQDEQRQAETARQQQGKMPPALEEYLRKRQAEIEQFRTVSPALKPYYKQLVEEYLKGK